MRVDGPAAASPPARPAGRTFGDAIRLAGYDLSPATLKPGAARRSAYVALAAHCTGLDADYTTFVHLVDADGDKTEPERPSARRRLLPDVAVETWRDAGRTKHTLALPAALGPAAVHDRRGPVRQTRPGFSSWVSRSRSAHCPDNVFALRASFVMWYTRDQ